MKKDEVFDIIRQLNIKSGIFYNLKEIDSIKLNSGREIFPDWLHTRFCFDEKHIKIQYGHSHPYGGRINSSFYLSADLKTIMLSATEGNISISQDPITGEIFRQPKFGDTLRVSIGKNILSEAIILGKDSFGESVRLTLSQPVSGDGRFSFFDSMEYSRDQLCDHGSSLEGVYMKFQPNKESISKKEIIHEIIPYNLITEITLSVQNKKRFILKGANSND